ncbi:hypothetical protein HG531_011523 [Fusarium graminearum]|nr:hypothetical protein HG531_011523 [Fusarium graminearum]
MSRHHPDLVMCRKQAGIAIGRLCDKCDGKCPVCDSYVRPTTLVRICDECSFGNYQNKCVVCGGEGISDAFYCFECTRLEKDRDGCPKIINLGSSRTDLTLTPIPAVPLTLAQKTESIRFTRARRLALPNIRSNPIINAINLNKSMGFALSEALSFSITTPKCEITMDARDARVGGRETALPLAFDPAWLVLCAFDTLDCLDDDDKVLAFRGRVDPL